MRNDSPEIRATKLAALWAQRLGLPPNNQWQGPVARNILAKYHELGADANAWGFVEALYRMQLGLEPPK